MKPTKPTTPNPVLERLGPTATSLKLRHRAYPLVPGSSIDGVVMRELCSHDDDRVSQSVQLSPESSNLYAGKVLRREAMRLSIVAVVRPGDGKPTTVEQPFADLEGYNLATINQLSHFFELLNGTEDNDVKKAVAAATDWQPGDGVPTWSDAVISDVGTGSE